MCLSLRKEERVREYALILEAEGAGSVTPTHDSDASERGSVGDDGMGRKRWGQMSKCCFTYLNEQAERGRGLYTEPLRSNA